MGFPHCLHLEKGLEENLTGETKDASLLVRRPKD